MKEELLIPQIYLCEEDNQLYCAFAVSKAIYLHDYMNYKRDKISYNLAINANVIKEVNTEFTKTTQKPVCIWYDEFNNEYVHMKAVNDDDLVLYKALFDDGVNIYIEDKEDFLEKMKVYDNKSIV